jgi:O-antigen ligase
MRLLAAALACAALLLQPVQCLKLPGNLQLPDLVGLLWLPFAWMRIVRARAAPQLPLFGPFAWICAASLAAAAISADPIGGAIAVATECWLYAFFATLAFTIAMADERERRAVLWSWAIAGIGNGMLILLQFARPDAQASMSAALGSLGSLDPFRPSGLFENCNSAAFFQLSAIAPVAMLRLRPITTALCAFVLLLSMLGTGSMGAVLALSAGTIAGTIAVLVVQRDGRAFGRIIASIVAAAAATVALATIAMALDDGFAQRVDYVLTGRGEGSAQSRMHLWTRGVELLQEQFLPLGIGPDRFKDVAGFGMHNDALSFAVERGAIGFCALVAFALAAFASALSVARNGAPSRDRSAVVPIAALIACATLAQTHEIFHQRPLWLLLALQEGARLRVLATATLPQRRWLRTRCSTAPMTWSTSSSAIRE